MALQLLQRLRCGVDGVEVHKGAGAKRRALALYTTKALTGLMGEGRGETERKEGEAVQIMAGPFFWINGKEEIVRRGAL